MDFRVMKPEEQKYSYEQGGVLMEQTGCLSHIKADFGQSGTNFNSYINNVCSSSIDTTKLNKEINKVIDSLRFEDTYGNLLYNRESMRKFIGENTSSRFTKDRRSFGFRADTDNYTFLLRCSPSAGEDNLNCFVYEKNTFDNHLVKAKKGIQFIDIKKDEKIHVEDGAKIRIITDNGESEEAVCRYIDDYHFELDNKVHRTREFVNYLTRNNKRFELIRIPLADRIKDADNRQGNNKIKAPPKKQVKSRYYYKLRDLALVKEKGMATEGYRCIKHLKLYSEAEYKATSDNERLAMWGVYKQGDSPSEPTEFNSINDAYEALIEMTMQMDMQRANVNM